MDANADFVVFERLKINLFNYFIEMAVNPVSFDNTETKICNLIILETKIGSKTIKSRSKCWQHKSHKNKLNPSVPKRPRVNVFRLFSYNEDHPLKEFFGSIFTDFFYQAIKIYHQANFKGHNTNLMIHWHRKVK